MKQLIKGLGITNALINDIIFICESRTKSTYFTRSANCKMDFQSLMMFGLNFVKKTLQIELGFKFKTLRVTRKLPLNKIFMRPFTYRIWWHLRRMKRTRKLPKRTKIKFCIFLCGGKKDTKVDKNC